MARHGLVRSGTAWYGVAGCGEARRGMDFQLSGINNTFEVHVGGPTDLECALHSFLEQEGVQHQLEWRVPGTSYRLDAYAEVSGEAWRGLVRLGMAWRGVVRQGEGIIRIGFEADGPTHYTPKGRHRDRIRDRRILASGHVDAIVRLGYRELKPWM